MVNRKMFVDVEVGIDRFAQELAGKNNEEQAVFFEEFFKALEKRCGDQFHAEIQCHTIRDGFNGKTEGGLTEKTREYLLALSGKFK